MVTEGSVLGIIRAARPQMRSPHDRVAFAVHAVFQAAGYSLCAVGSDAPSELPGNDDFIQEVGIEGWNDMNGVYAFLYSGAGQDSLCKFVLVKCFSVEDNLFVAVSDDNDKEALQYEIRVSDYVTTSDGTNYAHLYKRLNELVEQLNTFFLSKLPSSKDKASVSRKESHEDVGTEENIVQPSVSTSHPAPSVSGIRLPPVPDFGRSDLLPGAGAGVFPSSIGGPGVTPGVGGMLVGPHDPRWGGMGFGEIPGLPEGDRGIVPPGARYDPIGPPGIPGFEPGRFGRSRRPPSGGVNPDLEHFKPF